MWKLQSRLSPDSSNNPFVFSKPTSRSCQWFIASRLGRVVPLKAGGGQNWLPYKVALTILFLVAFASPAFAQISAAVSGTVTDPSGAPVPAASVTAKNADTGAI